MPKERQFMPPPNVIEDSLFDLQEDYKQCYKIIKKTYELLERIGLTVFNKYSEFKWNYDKDKNCNYICIRSGSSLNHKIYVKSSAFLEEAELYRLIENKDIICDALEEAYEFIRKKIKDLKLNMEEVKNRIMTFEEDIDALNETLDELPATIKILEE